jgi:hypothetical protein
VDYFTNGAFLGDINVNEMSSSPETNNNNNKGDKSSTKKHVKKGSLKGKPDDEQDQASAASHGGTGGKVALAFGAVMEKMWQQQQEQQLRPSKKSNDRKKKTNYNQNAQVSKKQQPTVSRSSKDVKASPSIPESDVPAILKEVAVNGVDTSPPLSSTISHRWPVPKVANGSLDPSQLKLEIGAYDNRFAGFQQHDAHELLSALLGALAEDLNRVKVKPYVELDDSDGRPDRVVANEWWKNHTQRELSIITALFTGQFKSQIKCTICPAVSARFEPFVYLSLSLPATSMRVVYVTLVSADAACMPMVVALNIKEDGTLADVKAAIVRLQPALRHKLIDGVEDASNGSIDDSVDIADLFQPISTSIPTHVTTTDIKTNRHVKKGGATRSQPSSPPPPRRLVESELVIGHVANRYIYSTLPDQKLISTLRAGNPLFVFQLPLETCKTSLPAIPQAASLQFVPHFAPVRPPKVGKLSRFRRRRKPLPPLPPSPAPAAPVTGTAAKSAAAPVGVPTTDATGEQSRKPIEARDRVMIQRHLEEQLKHKYAAAALTNASHPLRPGTLVVALAKVPASSATPAHVSGFYHNIQLNKLPASIRQDVCVVVAVEQRDADPMQGGGGSTLRRMNSARSAKSSKSSKSAKSSKSTKSVSPYSASVNDASVVVKNVSDESAGGSSLNGDDDNDDDDLDFGLDFNILDEVVSSGEQVEMVVDGADAETNSLTTSIATTQPSEEGTTVNIGTGAKDQRPNGSAKYTYVLRRVDSNAEERVLQERIMVVGAGGPGEDSVEFVCLCDVYTHSVDVHVVDLFVGSIF